jgi:hypothetical protein
MLVLKPDRLLLSVLKQKVSKEFKHRLCVAAMAEQGCTKITEKCPATLKEWKNAHAFACLTLKQPMLS